MNEKMEMIFTKEEIERITLDKDRISLDLHKLTVKQAQRLVNNLISIDRDDFTLTLIHGYHGGTAIKDMLCREFTNPRITDKRPVKNNQGRMVFSVKKAS